MKQEVFAEMLKKLCAFVKEEEVPTGVLDTQVEFFMTTVNGIPDEEVPRLEAECEDVVNTYNELKKNGVAAIETEKTAEAPPAKKATLDKKAPVKKAAPAPPPKKVAPVKPAPVAKAAPAKAAPVAKKVVPAAPVKKAVATPKPKKEPKPKAEPKEKSRYGHRVGSSRQVMDDLLWEGTTQENVVKVMVKTFGITESRAATSFRDHVKYLPNEKNIPITIPKDENGKYKATKAKLDPA